MCEAATILKDSKARSGPAAPPYRMIVAISDVEKFFEKGASS